MRRLSTALALCAGLAFSFAATAQTYPDKPIRFIVPFAAGGGSDFMARLIGQKITDSTGQTVIIDNRPGADTIIGAQTTAKSPPDGYTVLFTIDMTTTMNQFLYTRLPYDPVKDLMPVSLVGEAALLLVGNDQTPVRNVKDLVAHAKANPGKLFYGSGAIIAQLTVEMLKQSTGIDMVYVPFKGAAPATQALLARDIQFSIADFASYLPYIKSGKLNGIATTGKVREPLLPDVPTMIESGLPEMDVSVFWAVYAPAGTPKPVVDKLSREIAKAVATPEVIEKYRAIAVTPVSSTPEELAVRQKHDADKWRPVIKAAGIKLD